MWIANSDPARANPIIPNSCMALKARMKMESRKLKENQITDSKQT